MGARTVMIWPILLVTIEMMGLRIGLPHYRLKGDVFSPGFINLARPFVYGKDFIGFLYQNRNDTLCINLVISNQDYLNAVIRPVV